MPSQRFQSTAPQLAAVSIRDGSSSCGPCCSLPLLLVGNAQPSTWLMSSLFPAPETSGSSRTPPYWELHLKSALPSQASPDPCVIWHATAKSHWVRSHPCSCDLKWKLGNAWIRLAMSRYFHICFHSDSGLSYSAHQHVWQYRDTALAWRRLQPSVLLNDRNDENGFARPWKTQGCLLKTVVPLEFDFVFLCREI